MIEVNVGEEEEEWLPAEVVAQLDEAFLEVRMLVGYEADQATFEVDTSFTRPIPKLDGR